MIELLFALAFWPWALVLALVVGLSVSVYSETVSVAAFVLLIFFTAAWFFYGTNPLIWIRDNPLQALMVFGAYVAIGTLWSLFKWRRRITSDYIQYEMKEAKKRFERDHPEADPMGYIDSYFFPHKARPSENKDRITSWISLWPLSAIGFVIGDVLIRFFQRVYELLAGIFDRMTRHYAP